MSMQPEKSKYKISLWKLKEVPLVHFLNERLRRNWERKRKQCSRKEKFEASSIRDLNSQVITRRCSEPDPRNLFHLARPSACLISNLSISLFRLRYLKKKTDSEVHMKSWIAMPSEHRPTSEALLGKLSAMWLFYLPRDIDWTLGFSVLTDSSLEPFLDSKLLRKVISNILRQELPLHVFHINLEHSLKHDKRWFLSVFKFEVMPKNVVFLEKQRSK